MTDCEETHFGLQSDLMPPKPSARHEFSSSSSNTCRVVDLNFLWLWFPFTHAIKDTHKKYFWNAEEQNYNGQKKYITNCRSDSTEKSMKLVLRQSGQPEL